MKTEEKGFNGFKFGTFIGRFPSDRAAGMAVKGLNFFFFLQSTNVSKG